MKRLIVLLATVFSILIFQLIPSPGYTQDWRIYGVTQFYFGSSGDEPIPADYDGDSNADAAYFRASSGLWAVRGFTQFNFGSPGDYPVPADYNGDGIADAAYFRPASGLWAVRGVTQITFGGSSDLHVPADYTGSGSCNIAYYGPISAPTLPPHLQSLRQLQHRQ